MIGQTLSHYRIIEPLGQGGMGIVYLAEDTLLGRRVAIKTLNDSPGKQQFRNRFLREARAVSALSHPNIAAIHDYGETVDGKPYIVMEFIKGKMLDDLIREGSLTLKRALEIIADVAEGLAEAHRHGIVHRDIKPSNIAINERGHVKVLDFGLAKQLNEPINVTSDPEARTLLNTQTRDGVVVGTPMYLSPEQALGITVDARSDLFSLGSVLYECIAGQPAFYGISAIDICAKVIRDDPPPPSQFNTAVSPDLDYITLKTLAKTPKDRYQSAEELLADLRSLAQQRDEHKVTTRLHPSESHTRGLSTISDIFSRPRLSVGVTLLSLIVLAAAFWGYMVVGRPKPHVPSVEAKKWYEIGTNDLREGAYFQAIKPLERAVTLDKEFALAHARLAEAWTELDYTDRAQVEILRVDGLVPNRTLLDQSDALYLDAIRSTITRDFSDAIRIYSEIVRLKPNEAQAHLDLGRAYEKNDEIDRAMDSYRAATTHDAQYAAAFLRLGSLHGRKGDLVGANTAFDNADALFQTLGDVEGRTEVLYQRGSLLSKRGELPEAQDQLQKALEMARTFNNQYQQIKAMLQLSTVLYSRGYTEQAKQNANDAVNLAQNNGIENLATQGLIDLGNAHIQRREYDEAERDFRQALDFASKNKGRRNESITLLSLARLYIQQEINIDEAMGYLQQSVNYFQEAGYKKEASDAILLRGRAKLVKGDYQGALQDFDQQLQLAQQDNNQSQLATSHLLIGSLLTDQELYSEALRHFEDSYAISKSSGNQLNIGYSLVNRGDMLWRLGHYQEAEEMFKLVTSAAEHIDSKYQQVLLARGYLMNARMALSKRLFREAQANAEQAVAIAKTEITRAAIESTYTLGLAAALSGSKAKGRSACEDALERAKRERDPRLLSDALLALAEVLFESGDSSRALVTALQAQKRFAQFGQQESEWHAWIIAGRASQSLGDHSSASEDFRHAESLLAPLEQKWGTEAFTSYLTRPDVKFYRMQMDKGLASAR